MSRRLTDYASCSGCAGKAPAGALRQLVDSLPRPRHPALLVGTETHDDAGIFQLTDQLALVQTVDFFPPVVDDPYAYGQIAAANALSDVYAMGGTPITALNLACYPDDELGDWDWLGQILQGAAERCQAAGVAVRGGHTVRDAEIKFGLSVTGTVHPREYWTNAAARPGDWLLLTKPLGTGMVTSAARKQVCPEAILRRAIDSMRELNRGAAEALWAAGSVSAVTDVTGFGLAGHALEMAEGSRQTLWIDPQRLPVIEGVREAGLTRWRSRASHTNRDHALPHCTFAGVDAEDLRELLWDPQTSGGLLAALPPDAARRVQATLGEPCRIIGQVVPRESALLRFAGWREV